jgi:Tol biopolymer transport system component
MAAVLRDEPGPLRPLNAAVPPQLAWIVDRCLAKPPEGRYAATRDLTSELSLVRAHLADLAASGPAAGIAEDHSPAPRSRLLPWLVAVASLGAVAAIFVAFRVRRPVSSLAPVVRFSLPPPADARFFSTFESTTLGVSPDGTRVAFVADDSGSSRGVLAGGRPARKIWVRALSELDAHPLAGTEGASSFFWSPDGKSIGFASGSHLKRVDLTGGSPTPICDLPAGDGIAGTWGAGEILFANTIDGVIQRVSADGGTPAPLSPDPAGGEQARLGWPQFLPDGKSFLYLAGRKDGRVELMMAPLDGPSRVVAPMTSRVEFIEPGFVAFVRDGSLFAQRLETKTGRLSGPLLALAPSVYYFYSSKWAGFSVSRNGTLVFAPQGNISRLTWFDRSGRVLGEVGSAGMGETITLAISPDGRSALFDRTRPDLGTFDIWMLDLARGVESRVTSDPNTEFDPVWLPDQKQIVYSAAKNGHAPQLVRRALGGGPEEPLLSPGTFQEALDVTTDGRRLLFSQSGDLGSWNLSTLSLVGTPAPTPLVKSKYQQEIGRLSPDGRFLAFISTESGEPEAYVAAFGEAHEKTRLSTGGAKLLRWSRDGREIFFTSPDRRLFAVPVKTAPSLQVGTPKPLFSLPAEGWKAFDVSPDGRFLASVPSVSVGAAPLTVVVSWTSEIRP